MSPEEAFMAWLWKHGARTDKLEWPSSATASGVRGAVARVDIAPGEPMFEIPLALIIYPRVCLACAELRPVYEADAAFFSSDDDLVLALFLMHERLLGPASFWAPYLDILPDPGGVGDWAPEEQLQLRDRTLVGEAMRRPCILQRSFERLSALVRGTGLPNARAYSWEAFRWAWMIIQSRAFGRRLPWTALVPFADCLNHSNVPTRYELRAGDAADADCETKEDLVHDAPSREAREKVAAAEKEISWRRSARFVLAPSGSNAYRRGEEAFNSYGRRSNRFLLLEYGFCLQDNEWDSYNLPVWLSKEAELYEAKCKLLRGVLVSKYKTFRLQPHCLCEDMLAFLRFEQLDAAEFARAFGGNEGADDDVESRLGGLSIAADAGDNGAVFPLTRLLRLHCGALSDASRERGLRAAVRALQQELDAQEETIAEDEALLRRGADLPPRLRAAVQYRLGRKRILATHMDLLKAALPAAGSGLDTTTCDGGRS